VVVAPKLKLKFIISMLKNTITKQYTLQNYYQEIFLIIIIFLCKQ